MNDARVAEAEVEVRWGDQDPFGHVNHACFASYFEHARIYFFEALGLPVERLRTQGEGPILVRFACDYKQELNCGDTLRITTSTREVGRSSFKLRQVMYKRDSDTPAAEAEIVLVWFDYFTRQPQALAPAVRDWLLRYLSA